MIKLKKQSGETIIEVLMTLIIVLLAVISAFKMLTMAFLQKNLTQDRVEAINLAREGIEAVRYIRDYNWLYYGSNQRVCWNHLEDNDNDGDIDGNEDSCTENGTNGFANHQFGTGTESNTEQVYILKQKTDTSHWFLTVYSDNYKGTHTITNSDWDTFHPSTTIEINTLKNKILTTEETETVVGANRSTNTTTDIESFRLCRNSEEILVSCEKNINDKEPSKFFRYVKISYTSDPTDTDDGDANGLSDGQEVNQANVIVGVKWFEQNVLQDVELATVLSDFYNRTDQDAQN